MKRFLAPLVILGSYIFLTGMGDLGGSAPADKIPSPEKSFSVRVSDREGIQTPLSQFSQEGKVFLTGKRGSGTVTVPFEKISRIEILGVEGNEIQVKVSLHAKESLDLKVDRRAKFYGQADFGTFQIDAKDLKAVNFLP